MDFSKVTPAQVQAEASAWAKYLNEIIGVLGFSFGLASVSTTNPAFYSIMSFIMIGVIRAVNIKEARLLHSLQSTKNKTEHHQILLKDYFSYVKWKASLPALFGYCFLSFILFFSIMGNEFPLMRKFLFGH